MSVTLIAHKLIYTVYPNTKSSTDCGLTALQHNSTVALQIHSTAAPKHCSTIVLQHNSTVAL